MPFEAVQFTLVFFICFKKYEILKYRKQITAIESLGILEREKEVRWITKLPTAVGSKPGGGGV